MNASTLTTRESARYQLRFSPVIDAGRALSFPCDAAGHVDIDALAGRVRLNYFYARTLIGREFLAPTIEPGILQH